MKPKFSKAELIIIILIGVLICLYVVTKASFSSFTHDESFSYLHYPHDSFLEIISFSNWFMNNHILNSLFMKYSELLLGNSELALRLPNLLLLLVYMIYSYRIFRGKNIILTISIFTILCTNVLLISLFGLARGYGLSYGFMIMSLFHFFLYLKNPVRINLYSFHFAALLAVLSHFTLLTFYISILAIVVLVKFLQPKSYTNTPFQLFKSNKQHIFPLLLNLIVLYEPVRRAITYRQFDVGGKVGFYSDSVSSFVLSTFNGNTFPIWINIILQVIVTLIVLIPCSIIAWKYIRGNRYYFQDHLEIVVTSFLLIFISSMIIFNNLILGSDYPIGRFLGFVIPLFWIHFGFLINILISSPLKKFSLVIVSTVGLISSIIFISKTDLHSYGEWSYDAETKNMIQDVISYRKVTNDSSDNVSIGVNWLFEPTTNFYRVTDKLDWLLPADRKGINNEHHYIYTFQFDIDFMDHSKYEIIQIYQNTNTILIKNKLFLTKPKLH